MPPSPFQAPPTLRLFLHHPQACPRPRAPFQRILHFHTSRNHRATAEQGEDKSVKHHEAKNHYEVLEVPTNATTAQIKKQFYQLSKTHHPDHNPNDPHASTRFVHLTTAYNTLSNPTSRTAYDLQTLPSSTSSFQTPHRHPQGSHFSTGPAGGRSPSGLSRRRAQFRGPPPSFYRSGGWGTQSRKREKYQPDSSPSSSQEYPNPEDDGNDTGTGSSADRDGGGVYGSRMRREDVPHFDREVHLHTHQAMEKRYAERRKAEADKENLNRNYSDLLAFLCVSAIIGGAAGLPLVLR